MLLCRRRLLRIGYKTLSSHCGKEVSCDYCSVVACYLYQLSTHAVLELLNHRGKEFEQQLAAERAELATVKEQLARTQAQEASLVHQNARMSMELAAGEKREKSLEMEVSGLQSRLSNSEEKFSKSEEERKHQQAKDKSEFERVQKELNEKSKVLREYQDKVKYAWLLNNCISWYTLVIMDIGTLLSLVCGTALKDD